MLFTNLALASDHARTDWVDAGKDFYAPTTFFGAPDGQVRWLGWAHNWQYAAGAPTEGFKGAQTFVRRLSLRRRPGAAGYDLVQTPEGLEAGRVTLRVFLDWSGLTVFADRGRLTITDRLFPDPAGEIGLVAFAEGGAAQVHHLGVRRLRSIWADYSGKKR